MTENEKEIICRVGSSAKGKKREEVYFTRERLYKRGYDSARLAYSEEVSLDSVTGVKWRDERFARFLVIGLVFTVLCCVLSAYFIPGGEKLRTVLGIVVVAVGIAVLAVCVAVYFACKLRVVTVSFAGGKLRFYAQGIADEEIEEFAEKLLEFAALKR